MTRWAVLEAVSAGLCGPAPERSLLAEGRAMWSAVIEDLSRISGDTVRTVVHADLIQGTDFSPKVQMQRGTADLRLIWDQLCAASDAAILIAPETGEQLESLVAEAMSRPKLQVWNAFPAAIRLCTDKLTLAHHLQERSIATLPTESETWRSAPSQPYVIKPRDGAGSWLVRRVDGVAAWEQVRIEYESVPDAVPIRQPFVRGRALSTAGWFSDSGVDWLPITEQRLSDDGRFRYLGGRIPATISAQEATAVHALVATASGSIEGLRGYIGFDVLQPLDAPLQPLLVEINPRFTTSYVGYRRIYGNLLARWMSGLSGHLAMESVIEFDATGNVHEIGLR